MTDFPTARSPEMDRHPNILNAASNLLGISFVIIAGLKLTNSNSRSFADELAWLSALLFIASVYLSYWSIRRARNDIWHARWGERLFIAGIGVLTLAILVLAFAMG
jgi:hypothetical protein